MARLLIHKINTDARGAILAELTICLSIFILLIFGAITVNDQIQQRQKLNSILRLISIPAVQDCQKSLLRHNSEGKVCLGVVLNNAAQQAKVLGSVFTILITNLIRLDGATSVNFTISFSSDYGFIAETPSRVNLAEADTTYNSILTDHQNVTVIEVFTKDPHMSFLFRTQFFGMSDILYDSIAF